MQEDASGLSLDDLRVNEEELRTPALFPVSIISCKTEFVKPLDDVHTFRQNLMDNIKEKHSFKKGEKKKFKEGFLEFHSNTDSALNCYFAKEAPTKIMYEADDLKIHTERYRLISPSFSVKVKIVVDGKSANVVLFGGSDTMIQKALWQINHSIREVAKGGHITVVPGFTKKEMNTILKNFGVNVEYIWIHPGESVRFMKMVEKRIGKEIKKVPEYIVHAKLSGYHITGSPITIALVEESGVDLKEIQGKFEFGVKINITTRVSSSGKVLFYIPENLVGTKNTVYDFAEDLYNRIALPTEGLKQATLGVYLTEKS